MDALPQLAHSDSGKEDGDDDELAGCVDFDDGLRRDTFEGGSVDKVLELPGLRVSLALDDSTGKDDAFEIEDREVVIVKFFCGMG